MSEKEQVAQEATPEVVQPEAEAEVSEETKSTEGQVEDPPAEGEAEQAAPEDDKSEAQKRRERRKAQIARLREEAAEAKRREADQAERLRRAREAASKNTPPKESDFQDYNEYLVAMGAYHAARSMDDRSAREIEEAAQTEKARADELSKQEKAELAQSWAEQVSDAKTRYADFAEVAFTAPISDAVAEMVAASDMGADIAYHLGKNPDVAQSLTKLAATSPVEAARELGRLEGRISMPKPRTQSSAPDPITPVKPKAAASIDPDKMSMAEYRKARAEGKI